MAKVRVIQWGLGAMGKGIIKLLTQRSGIELVGAIDIDSRQVGKDVGETVGLDRKLGVLVHSDPEVVLNNVAADVVFLATHSFVKDVFPQIMKIISKKMNVITTAEEMLYPQARFPKETAEMDAAARQNGVSILGTGINPGFILDTLVIAMTGACTQVDGIYATRVNDLSPFGSSVIEMQGIGITAEEFEKGVQEGSIVGHVGFVESISMIADCLGWKLDEIKEERFPIISNVKRETPYVTVQPGQTAGSIQIGHGLINNKKVITLEHPQEVRPELEDVQVRDSIKITGEPNINLEITPEISGGIGTIAMLVNMMPHLLAASPGVVTMKDLPLPYAWTKI